MDMREPVFEAAGLTKRYKKKTALDGVDLSLERGHIYGLIGRNGAGKSTLMRILMGLDFPTEGSIALFGQTSRRGLEQARRRIGALIEQPIAQEGMSAKQNLKLEAMLLAPKDKPDFDTLLRYMRLGPGEAGNAAIRQFSLGMRQRYGLAAALLGNPDFLVLDEPGTGLDPEGARDLRELLLSLNQEKGTTMLISSHALDALSRIATDFIVLERGRVIRQMTRAELEEAIGKGGDVEAYFLSILEENRGG